MMGRRYAIFGQRTCTSSAPDTMVGLTSNGTNIKRPALYDIIFGSNATPADNALLFEAQRYTGPGTGGTTTAPTPIDPADTPCDTTSVQANPTTDPTYTSNTILLYIPLNQRATHRWIADPNGPLVGAATSSNGIGVFGTHASFTGNISCHIFFFE